MDNFIRDFSVFLGSCREEIMRDARSNEGYIAYNTESSELCLLLYTMIQQKYRAALDELADDLNAINGMEVSYCYLRGLQNGGKQDAEFNPTAKEIPTELAENASFNKLQSDIVRQYKELCALIDDECKTLLDKYIEYEKFFVGVRKTYAYAGGMRDKTRLINLLDFSDANKWQELMSAFVR